MQIKNTTDYGMFKVIKGNRSLSPKQVTNLMKSIDRENLLEANPILINEDMEVVDGQHRLEAAKRLKIPIYYVTDGKSNLDSVRRLNYYKKSWQLIDFVDSYVKNGNKEYILLKKFIDKYNLSVSRAMDILYPLAKYGEKNSILLDGEFSSTGIEMATTWANMALEVNKYSSQNVWRNRSFLRAVQKLTSVKGFNWKRFVAKMQEVADSQGQVLFINRYLLREFLRDFEDVYNFKVPDKTRLRFYGR